MAISDPEEAGLSSREALARDFDSFQQITIESLIVWPLKSLLFHFIRTQL